MLNKYSLDTEDSDGNPVYCITTSIKRAKAIYILEASCVRLYYEPQDITAEWLGEIEQTEQVQAHMLLLPHEFRAITES